MCHVHNRYKTEMTIWLKQAECFYSDTLVSHIKGVWSARLVIIALLHGMGDGDMFVTTSLKLQINLLRSELYSAKQVCCFNHRVVTVVADTLKKTVVMRSLIWY